MSTSEFHLPMMIAQIPVKNFSHDTFRDHILDGAKSALLSIENLYMMAEMVSTTDYETRGKSDTHFSLVLSPVRMKDENDKHIFSIFLQKIVKDLDAQAYAFLSKAYMIFRKNVNELEIENPSEAPDRIPIIQAVIEFRDPRISELYTAKVTETPEGECSAVGPWEKMEHPMGRFCGMFLTHEDIQ